MTYEMVMETVAARPVAAVHRQVQVGGVATAWRPALDRVWGFLRRHPGLRSDGHNVFVYHHPRRAGDPIEVDFGVEVSGRFEPEGEVALAHAPAGMVASTVHKGAPSQLGEANAAIEAWCAAQGHRLGGVSWEVYGDPGADPGAFEVRVFYLLA